MVYLSKIYLKYKTALLSTCLNRNPDEVSNTQRLTDGGKKRGEMRVER
jgi:hypothetical protein